MIEASEKEPELNEQSIEVAKQLRALLPPAKYCPLAPSAKQLAFLVAPQLEVLYGGAAFGGKTVGLAMCALQNAEVPGSNALALRRTYAEGNLPEGIAHLIHKWLQNTDAHWDADAHTYSFPSGFNLTLGYLDNDDACGRYDGSAFQTIVWDELVHFPEDHYRYLFRRLRGSDVAHVPLRMRSGSNPDPKKIGHKWVRKHFVYSTDPDVLFISAKMNDNPRKSDDYLKSLSKADWITRECLINGNWDIDESAGLFQRSWFTRERGTLIDELPFDPNVVPSVRYWDFSGTTDGDWTVGLKVYLYRGRFYVADIARFRLLPADTEERFKLCGALDGLRSLIYIELEPGSAALHNLSNYQRNVLPGFIVRGERVTGKKYLRWQPVSALAENGNVVLLQRPWTEPLLDELELVGTGAEPHDDQADALSGAIRKLAQANMESWLQLYSDMAQRKLPASLPSGYMQSVFPAKPKPLCQSCQEPIEDGESFMQDGHLRRHSSCSIARQQKALSLRSAA